MKYLIKLLYPILIKKGKISKSSAYYWKKTDNITRSKKEKSDFKCFLFFTCRKYIQIFCEIITNIIKITSF